LRVRLPASNLLAFCAQHRFQRFQQHRRGGGLAEIGCPGQRRIVFPLFRGVRACQHEGDLEGAQHLRDRNHPFSSKIGIEHGGVRSLVLQQR
jgi:hypothetical protein